MIREIETRPVTKVLHSKDFMELPKVDLNDSEKPLYLKKLSNEQADKTGSEIFRKLVDKDKIGVSLSDEEKLTATQIMDASEEWTQERLGLDISARRYPLDLIRILPKGNNEKQRGWGGISEDNLVIIQDIDKTDFDNPYIDAEEARRHTMSHEILHTYANQVWVVSHPEESHDLIKDNFEEGKEIFSGFRSRRIFEEDGKRSKSYDSLTEAVHEMINIEVLDTIKDKQKVYSRYKAPFIEYPGEIILFDMIFDKMAEKSDLPPEDVRRDIFTRYFEGRANISHLLKSTLGREATQAIATLDIDEDDNNSDAYKQLVHATAGQNDLDTIIVSTTNPKVEKIANIIKLTGIDPEQYRMRYVREVMLGNGLNITGTQGEIKPAA